jgi:hypothetical protein
LAEPDEGAKASELWWRFLILAALLGFIGLDGLFGIVGKKVLPGKFGQTVAGGMVLFAIVLAVLGLTAGLIRFLKWAWKD